MSEVVRALGVDYIVVSVIIGYLTATTLTGSLLARRTRNSSDWTVGGGGMGILIIAVGIAGTRIGGAGTYGVAGAVIESGVWNLWFGITTFLALALVGLFFAIPYRRLRLQTIGEIFQKRFESRRCQWLTSLCVQSEYFIINLIEPYLIATILRGVFPGLTFLVSVFIGGAIAIGYLIYWKRTTEMGVFWGMLSGFGGGLVWYLLILYATHIQFEAPPGSGVIPKLFHYCFVNQGNGIDPSYVTTLIPLITIPMISLLTKKDENNKATFYRTLATHD